MMVIDRDTALTIDWLERRRMLINSCNKFERAVASDIYNTHPIYSTGYTNEGILEDNHWSITYTNEGKTQVVEPVSKSINTTKDFFMSIDDRPVHIYFAKQKPTTTNSEMLDSETKEQPFPRRLELCDNWNDLVDLLKLKPASICVNSSHTEKTSLIEILNMIATFCKLVALDKPISISIGVNKDTTYSLIKEAQKLDISGLVPSTQDFGFDECMRGLTAQWNNIPYWPKHIIEQLPGVKKTLRSKPGEIKLTTRQQQILNLIKERGASNKVIAKTLNITESTVKLHVGLVLKKFGVKNRTQLALFCK